MSEEKAASKGADAALEKKAAKARGSKKMSDKLSAVGAIGHAISTEVQKVIIGKSHVIDNVMINILSNGIFFTVSLNDSAFLKVIMPEKEI